MFVPSSHVEYVGWRGREGDSVALADQQTGIPGGVGTRVFKLSPQSAEQIRRFVDERLQGILSSARAGPADDATRTPEPLRLTIRVSGDQVEVTLGDEARTAHFRDWLAGILRHQGLS